MVSSCKCVRANRAKFSGVSLASGKLRRICIVRPQMRVFLAQFLKFGLGCQESIEILQGKRMTE